MGNASEKTVKLNGKKYILGKKYRDTVLGNTGIATAGVRYLTGCGQLLLKWNDTTKRPVEIWVDVINIEEIETATKPEKPEPVKGGPAPRFGPVTK